MHFVFFSFLKSEGLPVPETEFKFHVERKWKFDFAWPHYKIALEVEGGIFGRGTPCPTCKRRPPGAHSSIVRMLTDMEKYNTATSMGWLVLRCTPDNLNKLATIKLIKYTIKNCNHG